MEQTPHQLAQQRLNIAEEYSKLGKELVELKKIKAMWWEAKRSDFKSDTSAERAWDLTREGQQYQELQMRLKSREFKMSAIKTMLEVMNAEMRNQY